jgi:hypothetical protein
MSSDRPSKKNPLPDVCPGGTVTGIIEAIAPGVFRLAYSILGFTGDRKWSYLNQNLCAIAIKLQYSRYFFPLKNGDLAVEKSLIKTG